MLVLSYNPRYQSVLKELKPSTRQRMVVIELGFPAAEAERRILQTEADADPDTADRLVRLAQAIRSLDREGLPEVASTRVLVSAARLVAAGVSLGDSVDAAIVSALTDDPVAVEQVRVVARAYLR
jgi:nitric oxide reductase NorQ protein